MDRILIVRFISRCKPCTFAESRKISSSEIVNFTWNFFLKSTGPSFRRRHQSKQSNCLSVSGDSTNLHLSRRLRAEFLLNHSKNSIPLNQPVKKLCVNFNLIKLTKGSRVAIEFLNQYTTDKWRVYYGDSFKLRVVTAIGLVRLRKAKMLVTF